LTYKEFITQISKNINISKKLATKYSSELINLLNNALEQNEEIIIPGFGKFFKVGKDKIKFDADSEFIQKINQR